MGWAQNVLMRGFVNSWLPALNWVTILATLQRSELSIKLRHVWTMDRQAVTRSSNGVVGIKQLVTTSLIVTAILLGGLYYLNRPEHKYQLTIEVQTPGGVKSASGVMAVNMGKDGGILPEAGGSIGMNGDALFVDLGSGRNLIVALAHGANAANFDGMSRLAMNAFAAAGQKVQFKDVNRLKGKVEVHGDLIPTLVTSTDLVDPKAAQVIDPSKIEATFGNGFHLNRVIIEMVPLRLWPLDFGGPLGEPVTRGIETKLPWVTSVKGYLSGRLACNPSLEACLEVGHFRRK